MCASSRWRDFLWLCIAYRLGRMFLFFLSRFCCLFFSFSANILLSIFLFKEYLISHICVLCTSFLKKLNVDDQFWQHSWWHVERIWLSFVFSCCFLDLMTRWRFALIAIDKFAPRFWCLVLYAFSFVGG